MVCVCRASVKVKRRKSGFEDEPSNLPLNEGAGEDEDKSLFFARKTSVYSLFIVYSYIALSIDAE